MSGPVDDNLEVANLGQRLLVGLVLSDRAGSRSLSSIQDESKKLVGHFNGVTECPRLGLNSIEVYRSRSGTFARTLPPALARFGQAGFESPLRKPTSAGLTCVGPGLAFVLGLVWPPLLVGMPQICHTCGMARTRISTTVDRELLDGARKAHSGTTDAELIDSALLALLSQYRAAEIDEAYKTGYSKLPMHEPDEWGDLESFRDAAAAT